MLRKKTSVVVVLLLFAALAAGCSKQELARRWGGTTEVELKPGARVVTATWKENSLWILTKQDPNTPPQRYELAESSSFGLVEGKVVLIEK